MCHLRSGYSDYGPLSPPEHRSAHRRTRAISVHDYSANRKILFGFLPQTMEKGSLLRINEQTESGAETAYFENVLRTTLAGSFRTLGLDPGYRRLFVDYLRDYARSENKTVFLTSHIIQDMERLIDDCIIMDYGKILIQQPIKELLDNVRRYTCTVPEGYKLPETDVFYHPSVIRNTLETYSFLQQPEAETHLKSMQTPYSNLKCETVNLEDAFIGLTGKY